MHFGDSIFIFLLALVLFGPKKLPEIGRTIGKLLAEFRRASNEFKFQIQEELRNMEDEERRKKLAEAQTQKAAAETLPAPDPSTPGTPSILPPSVGAQVSTNAPFATPVEPAEPAQVSPTATPSVAEVIIDPPAPTESVAPPAEESAAPLYPHLDLTDRSHADHSNGAHTAATTPEPIEPLAPNEPVRHG